MSKYLLLPLLLTVLISCIPTTDTTESAGTTPTAESDDQPELTSTTTNAVAIITDEARIATALLAAPEESRAECTVIGTDASGEIVTLKEGTNQFICLADDPAKEGFSAACYHRDLEPFMARGRSLKAEGKTAQEVFGIREREAIAGTLDMGKSGTTLHIYYGPDATYDPATDEVTGAKYRYVVYMPFATAASTGLPEAPIAPNHPWLMDPGTHRAHIMISPLE
ncbi:hypothetical protein [Neolewinella antarctica]|uniref:Uncharacterized protein n=1 Tax=Neolewinella antarctica TaxID=442734 RepID=A0ABX0X6T7_9BACT|nr:hypothetical protein [Neolewinella antarctica]NJC24911.1 hypothetical protein [Neolewinella antarctica]